MQSFEIQRSGLTTLKTLLYWRLNQAGASPGNIYRSSQLYLIIFSTHTCVVLPAVKYQEIKCYSMFWQLAMGKSMLPSDIFHQKFVQQLLGWLENAEHSLVSSNSMIEYQAENRSALWGLSSFYKLTLHLTKMKYCVIWSCKPTSQLTLCAFVCYKFNPVIPRNSFSILESTVIY